MTTTSDPQSFDHLSHRYDRFADLVADELHAYLKFRLPRASGRAVDLGCGTGVHTALLAGHYNEVLAVDLSAPMLTLAQHRRPRGNVRYERRDLAHVTPWQDGQFDLVFTAYTLHHIPDLELALLEMRRLVRPGGQLIAVFTTINGTPIERSDDWREWRAVLAAADVRLGRLHDARHTAGTLMMEQGIHIRVIQEILGHTRVTTTEKYIHVASPQAQDASLRLGTALWGV